jgi:hypothetical protein
MTISGCNKSLKALMLALVLLLSALVPMPASADQGPALSAVNFTANIEALDYYMDLVEKLDVNTAIGKAVFYSGQGNRKLAEQYAIAEDKTTLEMTPGGKILDDLKLFDQGSALKPEEATRVWSRLSQRYAQQAAGDVFCFVAGARPTGVFTTVELPELKKNRKIGVMYNVSRL